jgi:hypothetical protein
MRYIVLTLSFLIIVGCATPLNLPKDACFSDYRGTFCQKDFKVLPPDFPPELFLEWFPESMEIGVTADRYLAVGWWGEEGLMALMVFDGMEQGSMVFAFIKVDNHQGRIIWLAKDAKLEKVKFLEKWLKEVNQDTEA